MQDLVIEQIVVNHYDAKASAEAGRPMFLIEVHSRHANHTLDTVDDYEFAEWLQREYRRNHLKRWTVEQITAEIRALARPRVPSARTCRFLSLLRAIFRA